MKNGSRLALLVSLLLLFGLAGCASVPMSSLERDREAKAFVVPEGKASIYLYRNESFGGAIAMTVSLDGRVAGRTGPNTYMLWQVDPGRHEIVSITENESKLVLETRAGETYFVWQEVKMGMWTAR
ncbi:MAG TPA: DUF2846 domain-containing protein, partial [Gammaproteobacteria bacterium]